MFHRLFFLGNFQRLDRQADATVALVKIGHHSVNFIADIETLRTLVFAVARQVAAADKGRNIRVANCHFQPAIINGGHFASHRIAATQIGDALKRVAIKLFNAKADALFFLVNIQHNRFNGLAFGELRQGFFAGHIPIQIGNMHHAVNFIGQTDKQPEFGDVFDFT